MGLFSCSFAGQYNKRSTKQTEKNETDRKRKAETEELPFSYEAYEEAVREDILGSSLPEEYFLRLREEGCIRLAYESERGFATLLHTVPNRIGAVSGFCCCCEMLYPELPITLKEAEEIRAKRREAGEC